MIRAFLSIVEKNPIMDACLHSNVRYHHVAFKGSRALIGVFLGSFEQCGSLHATRAQ
jgi:hypothetical protein